MGRRRGHGAELRMQEIIQNVTWWSWKVLMALRLGGRGSGKGDPEVRYD